MNKLAGNFLALASIIALAACQAKTPPVSNSLNTKQKPEAAVANLAKIAQRCWFKSGDKVFKPYRMANEVSSFAGQPRFLLVPRKNPGGLPLLVVQAEQKGTTANGKFTNINAFGPLIQGSNGQRILNDVNRWSRGETACT